MTLPTFENRIKYLTLFLLVHHEGHFLHQYDRSRDDNHRTKGHCHLKLHIVQINFITSSLTTIYLNGELFHSNISVSLERIKMNRILVLVVLLSVVFVISQAAIVKREISWECTWQCTSYNICTHRESIKFIKNIFDWFGRKKRETCPPYPRGCDCNNFG